MPAQPLDPLRAKALKLALERIDRHRGDYKTKEEQEEMLEELIERHDLQKTSTASGRGGTKTKRLTAEEYRTWMGNVASRYSITPREGKPVGIHDVHLRGSAVVDPDYLARIGHTHQYGADHSEDEDTHIIEKGEENYVPQPEAEDEAENPAIEVAERSSSASRSFKRPATPTSETRAPELAPTPSPLSDNGTGEHRSKKQKMEHEKQTSSQLSGPASLHHQPPSENIRSRDEVQEKATVSKTQDAEQPKPTRQKPVEVIDDEQPPILVSKLASRLLIVSTGEIGSDLDAIWTKIQSTARTILRDTGVNPGDRAKFLMRPSKELEGLYIRLFTPEWKTRAGVVVKAGKSNVRDMLEALIAAAIHDVYAKSSPWPGPKDVLKKYSEEQVYIDEILQASGKDM